MVFTTPRCLIASGTPRRYKRCGAYMTMRESPQGMEASIGCAAGDGMGGGIFAKTAKTPPLQSGIAGMPLRAIANDQHSPPLPRRKGSAPFIPGRGIALRPL